MCSLSSQYPRQVDGARQQGWHRTQNSRSPKEHLVAGAAMILRVYWRCLPTPPPRSSVTEHIQVNKAPTVCTVPPTCGLCCFTEMIFTVKGQAAPVVEEEVAWGGGGGMTSQKEHGARESSQHIINVKDRFEKRVLRM